MTVADILRQLQRVPDKADFAPYKAALLAAIEQREAITPELIAAIDRVSADPARHLENPDDCLHLFAIYLLAQFRERRAIDCFLRFFSLPGDQALDLTGDMVTEQGSVILASVCGGDPSPLLKLIHDETVNEFVRGQAIDGLLVQAFWCERPRNAVIEELRRIFHTLTKPGNASVWAFLVDAVCNFEAHELVPEARHAFAGNLVSEDYIGLEDLDAVVPESERILPMPQCERSFSLFCEDKDPIDAVIECSGWLCFRDEEAEARYWNSLEVDKEDLPDDAIGIFPDEMDEDPGPVPYIAPPKVGRNDPCPCGSGRKYKKCCGK
jgi:hypothetical protein